MVPRATSPSRRENFHGGAVVRALLSPTNAFAASSVRAMGFVHEIFCADFPPHGRRFFPRPERARLYVIPHRVIVGTPAHAAA